MGNALTGARPVQMPAKATATLARPNLGYTFAEGGAIRTDEGDVDIYVDEFPEPIIPA
jgi:hypothetical protein